MSETKLPMKELLSTQMSEENDSNNSNYSKEIIKRTQLKGTPFTLISTEDRNFIAMGKYRVSEIYNTDSEALDALIEEQWNITINVITLLIGIEKEEENKAVG